MAFPPKKKVPAKKKGAAAKKAAKKGGFVPFGKGGKKITGKKPGKATY